MNNDNDGTLCVQVVGIAPENIEDAEVIHSLMESLGGSHIKVFEQLSQDDATVTMAEFDAALANINKIIHRVDEMIEKALATRAESMSVVMYATILGQLYGMKVEARQKFQVMCNKKLMAPTVPGNNTVN